MNVTKVFEEHMLEMGDKNVAYNTAIMLMKRGFGCFVTKYETAGGESLFHLEVVRKNAESGPKEGNKNP